MYCCWGYSLASYTFIYTCIYIYIYLLFIRLNIRKAIRNASRKASHKASRKAFRKASRKAWRRGAAATRRITCDKGFATKGFAEGILIGLARQLRKRQLRGRIYIIYINI